MLKMRTNHSYQNAIRAKYIRDKASVELRGDLYKLTPGNIRNVCLSLINEDLSKVDEGVMKIFFNSKDSGDLRRCVSNYDIDGFRPICKFLKEETDSISAHATMELTAVLINFKLRPYSKYRAADGNKTTDMQTEESEAGSKDGQVNSFTESVKDAKKEGDTSNVKSWYIFIGVLVMSLIGYVFYNSEVMGSSFGDCIVWNIDHYERTYCSGDDLENRFDKGILKNFKKIEVCEDFIFFENGNPIVHYLKFNNEIEYFTSSGEHPIYDGKYLKPITRDIINAHVKPCDSVAE